MASAGVYTWCLAQAGLPRPALALAVATGKRVRPENIDHEAHLPAKETQASPHAWVSRPYAHSRGKAHAQAAAQQGTQAPVHLAAGTR